MKCMLCPRRCGADRAAGETGYCGAGKDIRIAKAMLHTGEEPCLGTPSGAIFFTGCPLGCVYCQNKPIVNGEIPGRAVTPAELAGEMAALVEKGAANIDLVSPTQYADGIAEAFRLLFKCPVPVLWNTGGYERVETVRLAAAFTDIFLTDLKYGTAALSAKYSAAPDYPETALAAISEMVKAAGAPAFQEERLQKGVLVRHLVLPGGRRDSIEALRRLSDTVDPGDVVLSLLWQYTPDFSPPGDKTLSRRVTTFEYESVREEALRLGFTGYGQEKTAVGAEYTPTWDE